MAKLVFNGDVIAEADEFTVVMKDSVIRIESKGSRSIMPHSDTMTTLSFDFNNRHMFLTSLLNNFQTPANLIGYQFLIRALELGMDDPTIYSSITKRLYPKIADEFGEISTSKVERCLHSTIKSMLESTNKAGLKEFFGPAYETLEKKKNNAYVLSLMNTRISLLLSDKPFGNHGL